MDIPAQGCMFFTLQSNILHHIFQKICSPRSWFQHFWLYLTALSDRWSCSVKCHPGIYATLVHGRSQHFHMLHFQLPQTCSPTWICGSHSYCVHLFKILFWQYALLSLSQHLGDIDSSRLLFPDKNMTYTPLTLLQTSWSLKVLFKCELFTSPYP